MEVPVSDIEGGVDWAEWPEEAEEEEKEAADPNSLNNEKRAHSKVLFSLVGYSPVCISLCGRYPRFLSMDHTHLCRTLILRMKNLMMILMLYLPQQRYEIPLQR